MKNITIIRHAKSSWKFPLKDFDRPLKKRGIKDANLVAKNVKPKLYKPNLILSSGANRAKTTSSIFIEILGYNEIDFRINNKLYDFSGTDLIDVIKETNNNVDNLLLFGHNYAITNFVNTFGSEYFENVPTSGLVSINFNMNKWQELNKGTTIFKLFPKDLK